MSGKGALARPLTNPMTRGSVQAVIFSREMFNSDAARKFLKKHKLVPMKRVHKTKRYLRYRIAEPKEGTKKRIKTITNGIKFILEYKI